MTHGSTFHWSSGNKAIGSKWVYKVKKYEQGRVQRYKVIIVAQGFAQKFGVDFNQVITPVTHQATLRTFLVVAAEQKMFVRHHVLDINTAYLNDL